MASWFSKLISVSVIKDIIKIFPDGWNKTREWWRGKNIAIIGATASGKDAMFNMLRNEEISNEHNQTRGLNNLSNFKLVHKLPNGDVIDFQLKKCKNVGGEEDQRDDFWYDACNKSDIIFYLIDINKLKNNPTFLKQRIKDDFKWISENISQFSHNKACYIFLNKVDLLIKDIPVEKQEEFLKKELQEHIDEVQDYAEKILGRYSNRIKGIQPISMIDKYTFKKYFSQALIDITEQGL